ncbi:hypothetical protein HanHA300_Chr01g0032331 [Helianthus annuus]|nr:hypothetical protein HanHA300_Chr01g0032331 [Helianthus annuus]
MKINFHMLRAGMNTGFADKYVAPRLSHHRTGVVAIRTRNSCKRASSHVSSATVSARALYSDSVEDRDTVFCFFADHETRFEPR